MKRFTRIRLVASVGALAALGWAGTFAAFSDDASSTATFTSGTVDLLVGGDADDAHTFTSLSVTDMKPGDVKYGSLSANNAGTLAFGYTMTATGSNTGLNTKNLHVALTLEVKELGGAGTCDAAAVTGFESTTAGHTSVLASATMATPRTTTSRTLAPAATDDLCFKVSLPSSAGNEYQAGASTATFAFAATQS